MEPSPPDQEPALKQFQNMSYNEYNQQYFPMQQPGAINFPLDPHYVASMSTPAQSYNLGGMAQDEVWKTQDFAQQLNLPSHSYQQYIYHQTMDLSQQFPSLQNVHQGYSNLRSGAHSLPNYTEQSPRKRQRINEVPTTNQFMHTIPKEPEVDTTSECCSSCPSGSVCAESDCGENDVVVACTSQECEQPVCTSPECEQPVYTEPCTKDGALSRRCSVVGDSLPSDRMYQSWDNFPAIMPTEQQQPSRIQSFAPSTLRNSQAPQEISPSPVPTTPSLVMNTETPYSDMTSLQTPGLPMQQLTDNMPGSSLNGTGMRFGDGLEMFSCNWLDCGQPMHDQFEWHRHFHQEHIDPQFTFNCPMPSTSCQAPLNSNPLDHLQINHGFTFEESINGFQCPAPGCPTEEMYCDPSMLHNHIDQMHAIPLQGQLQCQVDSCNTLYQDPNQFFNHLNHDHNLPIPMTPVEEIDLSSIPVSVAAKAEEKVKEETASVAKNIESESTNHLSCKWAANGQSCGQVFTSENDLQAHVKEVHLSILNKTSGYFCKWQGCSRKAKMGDKEGFSQRGKLERHMASHTGFKECTCDFPGCGKTFAAAQSLKQHYRLHTGEKPWKCKYCPKSFPQQSACTVHERIHTHEKPLECSICKKTFSESSNLAKHRKTHGERGHYECPDCPKTFHRLDQLKRHAEMHERKKKKAGEGSSGGGGDGEEGNSEVTESWAGDSFDGHSIRNMGQDDRD
ncbi:hypothetical protein BGAL_0715g00010 [Botrytis galanthina]|uniref:C2H2-type domain-containing protein n=1 Tax=Botrytis galanthina TaxID=278940 RepID=A0A4S8QHY1_9HELO|nr:hypothetical protein BGAL_0715g00010 [Botrytis galanthina]